MSTNLPNLPAPQVLDELSFDDRKAELLAWLQTNYPQFVPEYESDPVAMFVNMAAYLQNNHAKQINNAFRQTIAEWSTGTNLDNVVRNIGLTRLVKVPAVLDDDGNIETAAIMETDEALLRRYYNAWHSFSPGTEGWYKYHVLESSVDVRDCLVQKRVVGGAIVPGGIDVFVQSELAASALDSNDLPRPYVPNGTLLQRIRDYTAADGTSLGDTDDAFLPALRRRQLNDTVYINAISEQRYNIDATILAEINIDKAVLKKQIEDACVAFSDQHAIIGNTILLSSFYAPAITKRGSWCCFEFTCTDCECGFSS